MINLAVVLHHLHPSLNPILIKCLLPKEQDYILSVVRHLEAAEAEVIRVAKEEAET